MYHRRRPLNYPDTCGIACCGGSALGNDIVIGTCAVVTNYKAIKALWVRRHITGNGVCIVPEQTIRESLVHSFQESQVLTGTKLSRIWGNINKELIHNTVRFQHTHRLNNLLRSGCLTTNSTIDFTPTTSR